MDRTSTECPEARLAVALEGCIEELEFIADECDHCKTCPCHGDHADEMLSIDADEILDVHKELAKRLVSLKAYHVKLAGQVAGDELLDESLPDDLAELIEELESDVDDLESKVIP